MKRTFIVLFSLLFFSQVLGKVQDTTLRGSRSGIVSIYKDSRGFYIGGDFKYDKGNATDKFGEFTYPLMLGLYTGQSLLVSNCLNFSPYDCEKYDCKPTIDEVTTNFPYFSATGNYASSALYFDYNFWTLTSDSLIAATCDASLENYGNMTFGILGLGAEGSAMANYLHSPIFSVFLERSLTGGELLFWFDIRYVSSPAPVTRIITNKNWQADINGHLVFGMFTSNDFTSKLIFDINSDALGLPTYLFETIKLYLTSYGVKCQDDASNPNCTYGGYINALPHILIYSGNSIIPVPPQVYILNGNNTDYVYDVVLNMRALGSNYTGKSYVTPDYDNTIILGYNYMAHYYTVFDASENHPEISIYLPNLKPEIPQWIYIAVGVVAILALGCICRCCCCKKRVKKHHHSSHHAPLVIHAQKVDYIQPVAYVKAK